MTHFSPAALCRAAALLCLSLFVPALLGGCGSAGGSKDYARIRVADAAVNALTANVLVNGSSANGDLLQGAVSPYLYIGTGNATFFYTTTASLPASAVPLTEPTVDLVNGQFYTAYLVGRADVHADNPTALSPTDTRFLQVVVAPDTHPAVPSGQAAVRVLDAAPDGGTVDVLVNGAAPASAFSGVQYQPFVSTTLAAPYADIPAGSVSVQVNAAGTTAAVFPAQTLSLAAGTAYTLLIQQVTAPVTSSTGVVTPPAYILKLVSDNG